MELLHDQNFDRIQKKHSELGVPWTDPTFSASDASIGLSKIKDLPHNIQWKRPYVSCCYHYFLHDKNTIEMRLDGTIIADPQIFAFSGNNYRS